MLELGAMLVGWVLGMVTMPLVKLVKSKLSK